MICLLSYIQADTYSLALIGMIVAVAPSGLIMGQFYALARNHFMRLAPSIYEIAQLWLRATLSVGFFIGLLLGPNLYLLLCFTVFLFGHFTSCFIRKLHWLLFLVYHSLVI